MWCPRCHTEVAAEIAQNGQSLNCTSCGTEIQRIYAPSLHPETRSARELLDRWSKSDLLDTASETAAPSPGEAATPVTPTIVAAAEPMVSAPAAETNVVSSESEAPAQAPAEQATPDGATRRRDRPERSKPEHSTPKPRTTWRVDAAHAVTQPAPPLPPPVPPRRPYFSSQTHTGAADSSPLDREQIPPPVAPPATAARSVESTQAPPVPVPASAPPRVTSARRAAPRVSDHSEPEAAPAPAPRPTSPAITLQRRIDPAHESLGGPHFDLQSFLATDARQPGRSESIWGQVLAYAGVGLITVGTTLVLWAWFSKSPQYAPTGWLVCTVGQMLLFLGVITLISGGMQQTSHEVTRRVEYLGDRILRFEQSAEQVLRGPHFNEVRERAQSRAGVEQSEFDG